MRKDTRGRFIGPSETMEERFWPKVSKTDGCWLWVGAKSPLGYGYFWDGERVVPSHRVSYMLARGPIGDGMDIDHLCRVPSCVNPSHLEPVSHVENIRRGLAGKASGARQLAKTHCPKGHAYSTENTYINPTTKARHCRECRRAWRPKSQ